MPELPEVETVKNVLKEKLLGEKILKVVVKYKDMIVNVSALDFVDIIEGKVIKDVRRYGKWLIFDFEDYCLLSHLRMEGKYFVKNINCEINKHEHILFYFSEFLLSYHDVRKFGKMYLIKKELLFKEKPLSEIGVEPFSKKFNVDYLKNKFSNKKIPIKSAILDQSIIAGIGNIYANEILFASKINPFKSAKNLTLKELEELINNSKIILKKAILNKGTTIRTYTSSLGVIGNYQNFLLIHGKEGEKCPNCSGKIKKVFINQRGTYYCEKCQK